MVHLALGDRAGALDLLERAYRERDARATFLRIDARWQPLAKEPRFHAILTRMNFDGPRALDAPQAAQKE